MEENASNFTTLIFKNIPKRIDDIKSLLDSLCISPKEVRPFGRKRALLTYERRIDAEHALEIIRKLEFSGRTANISLFCKEKLKENKTENLKTNTRRSHKGVQTTNEAPQGNLLASQQISKYVRKLYATEGDLCFDQPPPPYLKYRYPPINKDILDNIAISLLSNKRFYTQVLHLMNRMNLEPPFNTKSYKFTPPGVPKESSTQTDEVIIKEMVPSQTKGNQEREEIETEMESSEEDEVKTRNRTKLQIKRKLSPQPEQFKKKAKQILQTVQKLNKETPRKPKAVNLSLKDIFETSGNNATTTTKIDLQLARPRKLVDTKQAPEAALNLPIDLKTQKLTLLELENLPIYKNYQRGQPSNKLYIKNLHKDVTIEDIRLIYERYIKDNGLNLDIKVMQHGRMKGQAFVTFQGDQMEIIPPIIAQALEETNGFILRDKPMVVCYGKQQNLGLIDTIYIDGAQPSNNTSIKTKSKLSQQSYEYVIAVDFEATCWEDQAPPQWRESEIIEFPAVLINLKTGKIEAEFHKYIMPIESPKLSAFCTKLTGITQKTVDNGIPLQTALMMFQEWLRKELRARHLMLPKVSKDNKIGNCAFVTWTDWDFGICLEKECNRKRIKKPPYFNQWIDIRVTYRNWYKYKPLNFLDALTHVGLHFEGKQHSGIDDAKNLAALTHKLVNDGATLTLTKDLTPFQLNLNCVF